MRESHDVVVIGGGHNGLVAAITLAQAGCSVCLVEAGARPGGCATTQEPLLPGYKHSPHANCFLFADIQPTAFAPASLGVETVQPEAQLGVAFADGRAPVILHRPDLLHLTRNSLAAYSRAEADRFCAMKRDSAKLDAVLQEGLFAPPSQAWFQKQRDTVAQLFRAFCDEATLGEGTARQLIDKSFQCPEIRVLLYVLALETGVGLEEAGSDLAFLGYSLWIAGRWRAPFGGMQAYADALEAKALAAGVEICVSAQVRSVDIENGRAAGITTAQGRKVSATTAVVAAIPILPLFERLLDTTQVSASESRELDAFRRSSVPTIGTTVFCLEGAPRYKSGKHDNRIDHCLKTAIGFEKPDDVIAHVRDLGRNLLPAVAGVVRMHSRWDKRLAPPDHHIAAIDSNFPAAGSLDLPTWNQVREAFPSALRETWQRRLLDELPVGAMGTELDSSGGFERRMLLRLGADQYRSSIPGLYLAGAGVYPGGGVHGAPGYNAAATLLSDIIQLSIVTG